MMPPDSKRKILVVDDEPYMHVLLRHHLERAGYEVLQAGNGREAIELAARERPAVIVMDFRMQEMDGLSALKQLKAGDGTKDIPVIMLTANAHDTIREAAETAGIALFLTKPFSPTKLVLEIRRLAESSGSTG
jgi:CheY-like chemotaxis protein